MPTEPLVLTKPVQYVWIVFQQVELQPLEEMEPFSDSPKAPAHWGWPGQGSPPLRSPFRPSWSRPATPTSPLPSLLIATPISLHAPRQDEVREVLRRRGEKSPRHGPPFCLCCNVAIDSLPVIYKKNHIHGNLMAAYESGPLQSHTHHWCWPSARSLPRCEGQ